MPKKQLSYGRGSCVSSFELAGVHFINQFQIGARYCLSLPFLISSLTFPSQAGHDNMLMNVTQNLLEDLIIYCTNIEACVCAYFRGLDVSKSTEEALKCQQDFGTGSGGGRN